MAPKYVDSHVHLFYDDYRKDIDIVLSNAKKTNVEYFIVPGVDLKTSEDAIKMAKKYENIFACVGIHPHESAKAAKSDLGEIENISTYKKVVAIGEIGLDYYYDLSSRDCQLEFFNAQVNIAIRRDLPVAIHTRNSVDAAIEILENAVKKNTDWCTGNGRLRRGVFHCFPGTAEQAEYLHELGFYISYPGIITFEKSKYIEVIRKVGIEYLLLETDSPYLTPVPLRGKRNEPVNIGLIGKFIAEALKIPEKDIAGVTTNNAVHLFGLPRS